MVTGYRLRSLRTYMLMLAGAALLGSPLLAQVVMRERPEDRSKEDISVYVNESSEAAHKFRSGREMEQKKAWQNAAEFYHEVLTKHAANVVPDRMDAAGRPIRYGGVKNAVQEQLARWPQEGLNVYRSRFEPLATAMLEQAVRGEVKELQRIWELYFVTEAGKRAGLRLMDLWWESGDFAVVASLGERLLEWHPTLGADAPMVLYRTALCHHLNGDASGATRRLGDLRNRHPDARGVVGGREVLLAEQLDLELQHAPLFTAVAAGDSWPMFGGNPSRDKLSSAAAQPGAQIYSIKLSPWWPPTIGINEQARKQLQQQWDNANKSGMNTAVIPAIDRGQLFFQDGQRVYAVNLESGVPLQGWTLTYGADGDRIGQYTAPGIGTGPTGNLYGTNIAPPSPQWTVTVTDTSVLAVMGRPTPRVYYSRPGETKSPTRLVCLERETGKERWVVEPDSLQNSKVAADSPLAAKSLNFSGSPLVVGDNVFVIARGGTQMQVEDCVLVCLGLEKGELRWLSYVASANTTRSPYYYQPTNTTESLSHLAYAGGRVYVLTNLGVVGAIDAFTGGVAWLALYPRTELPDPRMAGVAVRSRDQRQRTPWMANAVIVHEGKVFALPSDGTHLVVYDAATGDEVNRLRLDHLRSRESQAPQVLLCVRGEELILASVNPASTSTNPTDVLTCVDWRAYNEREAEKKRQEMERKVIRWHTHAFAPIQGRPFVTSEMIYVPTKSALWAVNIRNGKVVREFLADLAAWKEGGWGNVVVAEDHVVVASPTAVAAYADLEAVRGKYRGLIASNPNDPEPRLLMSEVMFNAGDLDEALRSMDEAIATLGGPQSLRSGAQRDRLFSDALTFAQKLFPSRSDGPRAPAARATKFAVEFFNRAALAADTPAQHVSWRLLRADHIRAVHEAGGDGNLLEAVDLYQQVLSDPTMRRVPLATSDGRSAGDLAERAISELIDLAGRRIYAAHEQAADDLLASIRATNDPQRLLTVAQSYPNALAAREATRLAAEAFESSGNARMAGRLLWRLHQRYRSRMTPEERATATEAMARNYVRTGDFAVARKCLLNAMNDGRNGGLKLSRPMVLPDGTALALAGGREVQTLQQAIDALEPLAMRAPAYALPDLHLPGPRARGPALLKADESSVVPGVAALLVPPANVPWLARPDRLVAWTGQNLACYAPPSARPLWSSDVLSEAPTGLAWIEGHPLVWSPSLMALLDPQTGQPLWRAELRRFSAGESAIAAAGEAEKEKPQADRRRPAPRPDELAVGPERFLVMDGQVVLAGAGGGRAMADLPPPREGNERIHHVRPIAGRVVLSTTFGRLMVLDLGDGKLLWQASLAKRPLHRIEATSDFVVAHVRDEDGADLVAFDAFDGQRVWRQRFELNRGPFPVNIALAAEGTLVWTMSGQAVNNRIQSRILAKDLHEPGAQPTWEQLSDRNYNNMGRPEQLVVVGDQILGICDNGALVERRSLQTGKPLPFGDGTSVLTTSAVRMNDVVLHVDGGRVYVTSIRSLIAYNIARPDPKDWAPFPTESDPPGSRSVIVGRDHIVTLDVPATGRDPKAAERKLRLRAYSRKHISDEPDPALRKESGLLVVDESIEETAGMAQCQGYDGGIAYVTTDGRLCFLRGSVK